MIEEIKGDELVTYIDTNRITERIKAFRLRQVDLETLVKESSVLNVDSIDDKMGLMAVTKMRKRLKAERVAIEKEGKSMRDGLTQLARRISAGEKELIEIIEPEEIRLKGREEWVDKEAERIENERIQTRIDRLAQYNREIDIVTIKSLDDQTFEYLVKNAQQEWEKDQETKKEQERREKDEKLKRNLELIELERLRKKEQEADRIIEENRRKEEERRRKDAEDIRIKHEQRTSQRRLQLRELGMVYDFPSGAFTFDDVNVDDSTEVHLLDDDKWDELINKITIVLADRKAARAQRIKDDIERQNKQAIADALRDREEAEKMEKELQAEKLAQASDKVKLHHLWDKIHQLRNDDFPQMKSKKATKVAAEIQYRLNDIQVYINENFPRKKAETIQS